MASELVPSLKIHSVDIITVANALHWLDLNTFYSEAKRVLKRYGLIACWSYKLFRINPEIDEEIDRLYNDVLGSFWEPEERFVNSCYRSLSFPFRELRKNNFEFKATWDFEIMVGFLRSWYAVESYKKRIGRDPIDENKDLLYAKWGKPKELKEVHFPLSIRAGHLH